MESKLYLDEHITELGWWVKHIRSAPCFLWYVVLSNLKIHQEVSIFCYQVSCRQDGKSSLKTLWYKELLNFIRNINSLCICNVIKSHRVIFTGCDKQIILTMKINRINFSTLINNNQNLIVKTQTNRLRGQKISSNFFIWIILNMHCSDPPPSRTAIDGQVGWIKF